MRCHKIAEALALFLLCVVARPGVGQPNTVDVPSLRRAGDAISSPIPFARTSSVATVTVPGGEFLMGSPDAEPGRKSDEGPQLRVMVQVFEISRTPVTRAQFASFARSSGHSARGPCQKAELSLTGIEWVAREDLSWERPGFKQTDSDPVVCVSWEDAMAFVAWLNNLDATGRKGWRLPTEAEYEYAARAGSSTARYWSNESASPCSHANLADEQARLEARRILKPHTERASEALRWFVDCDDGFAYTSPVESFPPNGYGLYDMLGNVWQWVSDCYRSRPHLVGPRETSDPQRCKARTARGGSYADQYSAIRSATRGKDSQSSRSVNMGFRVARTAEY